MGEDFEGGKCKDQFPLSVGRYIFYVKQTRNNVSHEPTININRSKKIFVNFRP